MKKTIIFVAIAMLSLISCNKEKENVAPSENGITFTASIDELNTLTKATINGSYQFLWASGDKIGIFVNADWGGIDKQHNPFTLVGEGGSTTGSFQWDYDGGNFTSTDATIAFFPWEGRDIYGNYNNVYEGRVYFKMHDAYDNYTSGHMLTPLVASLSYSGGYAPIEFKHAGGAVKVTINNLPAGAHSIGLTVDGQNINGTYHIVPASFGLSNMTEDSGDGNSVWLNFEPSGSPRAFTFIFPVPALAADSDLTFQIYDKNDVPVWSRSASDQPAINHGQILAFDALNITPYRNFNTISSVWTVIGTANGTNWDADFPMITDGDFCIAKGLTFAAGGEFKVRAYGDWSQAYPGSNVTVAEAGTYDIIIELDGGWPKRAIAVPTGECPYPSTSGLGKGNDLNTPTDIAGSFGTYFN